MSNPSDSPGAVPRRRTLFDFKPLVFSIPQVCALMRAGGQLPPERLDECRAWLAARFRGELDDDERELVMRALGYGEQEPQP